MGRWAGSGAAGHKVGRGLAGHGTGERRTKERPAQRLAQQPVDALDGTACQARVERRCDMTVVVVVDGRGEAVHEACRSARRVGYVVGCVVDSFVRARATNVWGAVNGAGTGLAG